MKIKSKFFKLIKNKHGVLNEVMAPPMPPVEAPSLARPGEEVVAARETETITEPEPEIKQLTSEGEVELIRLILKALVVNPTEGTIPPELLDDEINENNGRMMLAKIRNYLNTYTDDPEINY